MVYVLSFERNKNDYVPIDLSLLDANLSITSLEELDRYTMSMHEEEFRNLALESNIYSNEEVFSPIVITYYENGKIRKLEEGPVFQDRALSLSISYILEYILAHLQDRETLNHLYNMGMKRKNKSEAFMLFLDALHQRKSEGFKQIASAHYIEMRSFALGIKEIKKEKEQEEMVMRLKNKDAA